MLTRSIREGLLAVWNRVNGVDGMVQWVERSDENRGQFYAFLTKILPHELAESGLGGNCTVIVQRSDKPLVVSATPQQVVGAVDEAEELTDNTDGEAK